MRILSAPQTTFPALVLRQVRVLMLRFAMATFKLVFFVLTLASYLTAQVAGQLNWGKKVPCYRKNGVLLCPGCNSRAGLQCPRRPEDRPEFLSCEYETTPGFIDFWTRPGPKQTTTEGFLTTRNTEHDGDLTTPDFWSRKTETPLAPPIKIFLFSYLSRQNAHRIPREAQEDTRVICDSNADCPCPLICCKQGGGCPKRCIVGLKLHPHFG